MVPRNDDCLRPESCCAPVQLLHKEINYMTDKIEALVDEHKEASKEVSLQLKALSEKQVNPEISKAWLIFYGVLITSGVSVINALIANYDKIQKALGG